MLLILWNFPNWALPTQELDTVIIRPYLIVLIVVVANALGQLTLKTAMSKVGRIGLVQLNDPVTLVKTVLSTPLVLVAVGLYGASFLAWAVVLSRTQLSVAYGLVSVTYVLVPVLSWLVLKEALTPWQWVGAVCIGIGIFLLVSAKGV